MRLSSSRNILLGFLLLSLLLLPSLSDSAAAATGKTPRDLKNLSIEQLMEIEIDTVYAASKYEQKITEAPSSVSIVTAAEIRNSDTGPWPTY